MGLTKISIDSEYLKNKSEVHILPCKIYFNGESDVKSFFSNNIIKNEKFQTKREDNIEGWFLQLNFNFFLSLFIIIYHYKC